MNSNSSQVSATSDELRKFRQSLSKLQTPSALERVVDWMGINEMDSLVYEVEEKKNDDLLSFCRCDYKANNPDSQMKNNDTSLTSVFNKSVPLCKSPSSMENKSICDTQKKGEDEETAKNDNEFLNTCLLEKSTAFPIAPPSVESKKKELCSYLKLMTRGDKKEVFSSQYRRSTRFQILEGKRKTLIKNLNDEEVCSEKSTKTMESKFSDKEESIALKSFEDLNMFVDTSKYPFLQENIERRMFNFVMPPDNVLKEFNDFKYWIEPLLNSHIYRNEIANIEQCSNLNNHNHIANNCDDRGIKMKILETNRIDRENKELNRFRKRIKKKRSWSGESCQFKEKIYHSVIDEKEQKRIINSENITHDLPNNHENGKNCIILFQQTLVQGSAVGNCDNNSPNIEEVDVDKVELENEKNIKIRIDYEIAKPNNENHKNIFKCYEIPMPNCPGFSRREIEKSEAISSKFNLFTTYFYSVPVNKNKNCINCSKTLIGNKYLDFCSCKNENNISNRKSGNKEMDSKAEEILSISSNTSGSLSSLLSDDSSTSNSSSQSENRTPKNTSEKNCEVMSPSKISPRHVEVLPYRDSSNVQTLHNLLRRQVKKKTSSVLMNVVQDWDSDNSVTEKQKFGRSKNNSHFISFIKENGLIQNAIYVDFHLILIQEYAVSLWNQTALGNVLGAQNLWIFNGDTKRLILNKECSRKHSLEMTISMENCVAYVELWTKEHKSDIRQGPVADIFAIVYFWFQKLNKMDKKVHQLENINGFSDDVQYVVLKSSLNIVVSWHSVVDDVKITQVHVYTLAPDFQTIVNVRALSKVEHYVSSLHNIEDCEELLMGCGEHTITLWNITHGYIVASIKLNDIKLSLLTLWAKCDRGILFTVQQCVDKELRLIAINGRSHSWKKLKSYKPPEGFERIQNVYIENGVLISFYEEGILCWKAQTGEQILEENHETDMKYFPSGKYVIMTTEKSIFIRHALTHLLTAD